METSPKSTSRTASRLIALLAVGAAICGSALAAATPPDITGVWEGKFKIFPMRMPVIKGTVNVIVTCTTPENCTFEGTLLVEKVGKLLPQGTSFAVDVDGALQRNGFKFQEGDFFVPDSITSLGNWPAIISNMRRGSCNRKGTRLHYIGDAGWDGAAPVMFNDLRKATIHLKKLVAN